MKKLLTRTAALIAGLVLVFYGAAAVNAATMPPYRDSVGDISHNEKITGLYLVEQSAARGDLIIYGASELRTTDISTHPANFFASRRSGFQVNLVGRGSCQSIIHAISIAAMGDALTGQKVALITSPQSYVPGGIAPDMFMANFSEQQYLALMRDDTLSAEVKQYISARVLELFDEYEAMPGSTSADPAMRYLAQHGAAQNLATGARNTALTPYYAARGYLLDLKDKTTARALLVTATDASSTNLPAEIDWAEEELAAVTEAAGMTANNDYGMLDSYYTTYIGSRLARHAGRDAELDYSASREYDDLRILLEICRQRGIEPLFIHQPLHGPWSDYTGFTAERREVYYENVRRIAAEYGVQMLDLTGYEYEEYFLCDVMHLGWKGWLEIDRALIDYYYGG